MIKIPTKFVPLPYPLIHFAHVRVQRRYQMAVQGTNWTGMFLREMHYITEIEVCREIGEILDEELRTLQRGGASKFDIDPMAHYDCPCGDPILHNDF